MKGIVKLRGPPFLHIKIYDFVFHRCTFLDLRFKSERDHGMCTERVYASESYRARPAAFSSLGLWTVPGVDVSSYSQDVGGASASGEPS